LCVKANLAEKSDMSTKVAEANALRMKQSHTHVTVEGWRNTKSTRTVHATQPLRPNPNIAACTMPAQVTD